MILNKIINKKILIIFLFISTSIFTIPTRTNREIILINYDNVESSFLRLPNHSATWYNLPGNKTYSGEKFHKDSLTAAYNFKSMGTMLKITNLYNNKSVIVRVNDKMGIKSKNNIDLSKGAFKKIASTNRGRIKVKIEEIL